MTRARKVLVGSIAVLVALAATAAMMAKPTHRLGDRFGCLHNLKPNRIASNYNDDFILLTGRSSIKAPPSVTVMEWYTVRAKPEWVSEQMGKALSPSKIRSSSTRPKGASQIFSMPMNDPAMHGWVIVMAEGKDQTRVLVSETHPASWFDRTGHWFSNLFSKKPQTNIGLRL